jgi:hypothetical protein
MLRTLFKIKRKANIFRVCWDREFDTTYPFFFLLLFPLFLFLISSFFPYFPFVVYSFFVLSFFPSFFLVRSGAVVVVVFSFCLILDFPLFQFMNIFSSFLSFLHFYCVVVVVDFLSMFS